uniref:F-box only protein 15-like n=1 Tax=Cyprinodon variegatus TaxID=28743 RepID=A0A3Q2FEQ8_CYPVA
MAAGRGEFFRSLAEGFERKPAQQAPEIQQPRAGRGRPNLGGAFAAERTGFSAKWRKTLVDEISQVYQPSPLLDFLRLPYEILIKILSYLDPPSLFCVGHVSRLFNRLSNDDFLWHRIYMSKFNKRMWKPKSADTHAVTDNRAEPMEDGSISRWKKLYFNLMTGQEMKKWMKLLREISPSTGLPWQTVSVLRNLNVSWELTLCSHNGKEHRLEQSKGHFFESSMILCWSLGICLKFYQISSIRLHGIRMEPQGSSESRNLHFHKLVEKSLLGSKAWWVTSSLTRFCSLICSLFYLKLNYRKPSSDYGGHEFQMVYRSPEGEVKMLLVWLQEQKQVFLIGLTAYISVMEDTS